VEDIGEVAKKIWRHPKFRAVDRIDGTKFIFSLGSSTLEKIKHLQPASFNMLFDAKPTDWERALKKAYRTTNYGKDSVKDLSSWLLFKVFAGALGILFEKAVTSKEPYKGRVVGDAKAVQEAAKRKRRPPDRERTKWARSVAACYDELFPQVKELCKFVKLLKESKNRNFAEAVDKQFTQQWVRHVTHGNALQNLPVIAGHDNSREYLADIRCTPRQLTVGIVRCMELEKSEAFSASPNRILEDYIPFGRKLNKSSSTSQKQPSK
jgi:hypothetical protein